MIIKRKQTGFRHTLGACARAALLATVFVGPIAGLAAARADDGTSGANGVGFVLYVSLIRP